MSFSGVCVICGGSGKAMVTSIRHPLCSDCARKPKVRRRFLDSVLLSHPREYLFFKGMLERFLKKDGCGSL